MSPVVVRIRRLLKSDLPLPKYHSALAAGIDLCAEVDSPLVIAPLQRIAVPTGLSLEIPEGYEGQVRPRSGLALRHGLTVPNAPGTIDADYRGELMVLLVNLSSTDAVVRRGDRVAQLVIAPVTRAVLEEVNELSSTARGVNGLGSTGI